MEGGPDFSRLREMENGIESEDDGAFCAGR